MEDPVVFSGRNFVVHNRKVTLQDGSEEVHEYVWRTDGTRIIAFNAAGRVLLTREFRHELDGHDWRIPGGKVDPGEVPESAAQREFREETGFVAERLHFLWATTPDSTVRYRRYFYLASGLTEVEPDREVGERLTVHWKHLSKAVEMALAGEILEEISALAILRVHADLERLIDIGAVPDAARDLH